MGQLHQILAVEGSKVALFKRVTEEAIKTFSGKENLFTGVNIVQESFIQDDKSADYQEYPDKVDNVPVQETVMDKLTYVLETCGEYFDVVAQKDDGNLSAKADIIVDGTVILDNVPATTLLFLENKLKVIRGVIESVKTREGAKEWKSYPDKPNVMQTSVSTDKIVKRPVEKFITVAPATDKHPAQVAKQVEQEPVAISKRTELTGLISSAEKHILMKKVDTLINATTQARQRANQVETSNRIISNAITKFLLG